MGTSVQLNLADRSGERTSLRIPTYALATGTLATITALRDNIAVLVAPLTLLSASGTSINDTLRNTYALPDDANAHREIAVRFIMQDANMNQSAFSLGGPDLAKFPFTIGEGGDIFAWDPDGIDEDLVDFVTTVLTVARHPISGLAMTMQRLELVGRSN